MTSGAPIGRYLLRERVARGGMGEVFRAVAVGPSGFEKPVIVKRIRPEHAGEGAYVDLFVDEAKRMTLLAHPNIVQVLDFGLGEGGDYFLVLELVDGVDLARLAKSYARRGERVPIPIALAVIQGVLRGLHHAHTQVFPDGLGLVHRDVSPGNVLLSKVGEVKLADFGVARLAASAVDTSAPTLVGKVHYMSPEQFEARAVDARADVFAAGVTLFELVAGALPFDRTSAGSYRDGAKRGEFALLSALRADAPRGLDDVMRSALAPEPSDRFESARAMTKAIETVGQRGVGIAGADDLADVVVRAAREDDDKPKRVIRLGAPAPPRDEGELTRVTAGDRVVFTMKMSTAPEPHAEPPVVRRRAWPAAVVGAAVAGAAVFGLVRLARSSFDDNVGATNALAGSTTSSAARESTPSPGVTSAIAIPGASASSSEEPPDDAASAPSESPRAPASSARRAPVASTPAPPRAAASSVAVAADCHGSVHLYAAAGWVVSGGPSVVQAPGRYDWPCGTFHLHAVSRADPKAVRDRGITIRPGSDAVFDLR